MLGSVRFLKETLNSKKESAMTYFFRAKFGISNIDYECLKPATRRLTLSPNLASENEFETLTHPFPWKREISGEKGKKGSKEGQEAK